ncbi:Bug family tripartite tricarboxylate transporter substrate binding protein [Pseudorhodoferax sp.]|uniref:Bug family tripartite tricarboxylate transporter substrate binding protein n=1 Tax=Pseudorhodoferax sp. TaxID=1993553 RepID=UPI002DD629F1|nr:tripartite tricarboxylate transporter substrate binding protein [Pseudorhodoferax sp.]
MNHNPRAPRALPMPRSRRAILQCALASVCTAGGAAWAADSYPSRPIKIVVPVAAGGGTDFTARLLADRLGPALGQAVVVENRPGGAGNLGVQQVVDAAPDGYTLVMPITSFPINPSLYKLGFDTARDLAPVLLVGTLPLVLVVHPKVPATNVKELVQLATTASSPVTFANSGTGTTAHLAGELFNHMAGTRMLSVPYKGGGPALSDLLGGHVQVYFSTIPAALPHIESGKVRALAVTSTSRVPELPQVATIDESGLAGFEVTAWFGLFAPARTPAAIIERLHGESSRVLAAPDVRQRLAHHGVMPGGGTPDGLRDYLAADMAKWRRIIQVAGIRLD